MQKLYVKTVTLVSRTNRRVSFKMWGFEDLDIRANYVEDLIKSLCVCVFVLRINFLQEACELVECGLYLYFHYLLEVGIII